MREQVLTEINGEILSMGGDVAKVCDDELWIILCNEIIKGLVGGL